MNEEIGGLFLQICRGRLERNTSKLLDCLSSLPEEEIWKRPNSHSNSVGNLILHLCGNARQWIISGIGGPKDVRQRVQEFSQTRSTPRPSLKRWFGRQSERPTKRWRTSVPNCWWLKERFKVFASLALRRSSPAWSTGHTMWDRFCTSRRWSWIRI